MYTAKNAASQGGRRNKTSGDSFPKWAKIFWKVYFILFGLVCLIFLLISLGWMGYMPSFAELENPDSNLATEVISSDGELLGTYYRENRSNCKYADLSDELKDALIATEDSRFYKHSGVDVKALFRVAFGVMTFHRKGGGSTITQQLAKTSSPATPMPAKSKSSSPSSKSGSWPPSWNAHTRRTKSSPCTSTLSISATTP